MVVSQNMCDVSNVSIIE